MVIVPTVQLMQPIQTQTFPWRPRPVPRHDGLRNHLRWLIASAMFEAWPDPAVRPQLRAAGGRLSSRFRSLLHAHLWWVNSGVGANAHVHV